MIRPYLVYLSVAHVAVAIIEPATMMNVLYALIENPRISKPPVMISARGSDVLPVPQTRYIRSLITNTRPNVNRI